MSCKNVCWIALIIYLSDRLLWWWLWTFYWTQKVHQFILKSLQLVPLVSQKNPVSTNIHCFKDLFSYCPCIFTYVFLSPLQVIQLKYSFLIFPCVIIHVLACWYYVKCIHCEVSYIQVTVAFYVCGVTCFDSSVIISP